MEKELINKIKKYQEQNDSSFKFILENTDIMKLAGDLGFLIGQMNSQLTTIIHHLENK
jgi:hypothetical protein